MKNGIYCENPVRVRQLGPKNSPWWYAITFENDDHRRRIFFLDALQYVDLDPDEPYLFCARGRKILRISPTNVTVGMLPLEYFWLRFSFLRGQIPHPAQAICEVQHFARSVDEIGLYGFLGDTDCADDPDYEFSPEISEIQTNYARSTVDSLHTVGADAFADILSEAINRWNVAIDSDASAWRNTAMFADLDVRLHALPPLMEVLNAYVENHPHEIYADFPKIDILF